MALISPRTGATILPDAAPPTRRTRLRALVRELVVFGGVGAIAYVVDAGGFALLRGTVLADHVLIAKTVSAVAAMAVAWIGNRHLTYRNRAHGAPAREIALFLLANGAGLAVALACLLVSRDVLGLTSALADNLSANVVGVGLGTLVRFLLYRHLVFRTPKGASA